MSIEQKIRKIQVELTNIVGNDDLWLIFLKFVMTFILLKCVMTCSLEVCGGQLG